MTDKQKIDALVEALKPLAIWAENERRLHRKYGQESEEEFMGNMADNAKKVLKAIGAY